MVIFYYFYTIFQKSVFFSYQYKRMSIKYMEINPKRKEDYGER